jgi:hypothetical protein
MISKKRNSTSLPDPAEFELVPLSDDAEFRSAQAELARAETTMLEAERRHSTTDDVPARERAAWREVEQHRTALGAAAERLREVADRKSLEICKRYRPEHERYLRELLGTLEATADVFGCLAGLQARIATAGYVLRSDIISSALPPAVIAIGSPHDFGSQISQFRRWLEREGIIQ